MWTWYFSIDAIQTWLDNYYDLTPCNGVYIYVVPYTQYSLSICQCSLCKNMRLRMIDMDIYAEELNSYYDEIEVNLYWLFFLTCLVASMNSGM